MRKIDQEKTIYEKAAKSINFDIPVLRKLEERSRTEGTTVSKFVNTVIRRIVMNDADYYKELAKQHAIQLAKYNHLKEYYSEEYDQKQAIEEAKT